MASTAAAAAGAGHDRSSRAGVARGAAQRAADQDLHPAARARGPLSRRARVRLLHRLFAHELRALRRARAKRSGVALPRAAHAPLSSGLAAARNRRRAAQLRIGVPMKNLFPIALLALAACVTPVTKEEMATADYGPKPVNYQDEIRSYLSLRLTDPKDAIVE